MTGWHVETATCSDRNGGLLVTGTNHETTDPLVRTFCWHIGPDSLRDSRYDFSACQWGLGAQVRFNRMTATKRV